MIIQSRLQNGSDPIMSSITHDFYTNTLSISIWSTRCYIPFFDRNMYDLNWKNVVRSQNCSLLFASKNVFLVWKLVEQALKKTMKMT